MSIAIHNQLTSTGDWQTGPVSIDGQGADLSVEAISAGGIPVRTGFDGDGSLLVEALLIQSRRNKDGTPYTDDDVRDLQIAKGHRARRWPFGRFETDPQTVMRELSEELGVMVAVGGLVGRYRRPADKYNRRDELVGQELKEVRVYQVELLGFDPNAQTDERREWAPIVGIGAEITLGRMRHKPERDIVNLVALAHAAVEETMEEAA